MSERYDKLIWDAADAIYTNVDGPLGRASMENLQGHELEKARAEAAFAVFASADPCPICNPEGESDG
jgi:hypothetical protein